ncbi:hypothetical protein ACHAWF_003643 [Thalassiosira exigua]
MLTVDVTPDGHGDCIRSVQEANGGDAASRRGDFSPSSQQMFVKPHEERLEIGKFRDLLRKGRSDHQNSGIPSSESSKSCEGQGAFPLHQCRVKDGGSDARRFDKMQPSPVLYYSRQNDCLRTEVERLFFAKIFPESFAFAEQAFGTGPPDAINLWIGDERSVSSMHKDHYENLFYVCSGKKEFILCPPSDVLFLHEKDFPSGTFCPVFENKEVRGTCNERERSHWAVVADDKTDDRKHSGKTKTKWIEPDIKNFMEHDSHNNSEYPMLSHAHPMKIFLSEGEMLYIPSLWYHRVTQTCETVGVNYWYDMKFDSPQWVYFNFLQNLKRIPREDTHG